MQSSTLEQVADIVIRRTMWEARACGADVIEALARAYPFGDDPIGYAIWIDCLAQHGIESESVDALGLAGCAGSNS